MEARGNELLPLATKIAREFDNIPGLPHAEIELAAQEALAHAARHFDPVKGDFTAYAARAMRQLMVAVASRRSPCGDRLAPSLLDDFTIQRELGRGGCGAVYLATPKFGGDPVAVKLMLSRAQAEPRAIEHFKREMQVIAGLKHPNIVRFLDSGSDQGTFLF